MAFRRPNKLPQFADLKVVLAQSRDTDSPTYQAIQILIERLHQFRGFVDENIVGGTGGGDTVVISGGGGGGGGLVAHAPTHSVGASDPVNVTNLAGYPGGTATFLRADHTFAPPPGAGSGMNLDYLGAYVPGQVYNDGDFVIGPDGILYECVVDGTNTAPEPWPGTGVAVNGTADATYWVVVPHSQLSNERALNGLGTGYVRSTVGEPSVVPTIPLTDTTGILPDNRLTSNVALKNIDNAFLVPQTLKPNTIISGPNSILNFYDPVSPVDTRLWRLINYSNGNMYMESLTDASVSKFTWNFRNDGYFVATAFAGDGQYLSNLNASALATGMAPTARLGTGLADATTYLRGDNTWQPIQGVFPSGLVVISYRPCPPGWTRITSWEGLFLRSGPVIGVSGGAATHGHTFSGSVPAHGHTGTTNALGDHNHSFSGSIASSTDQNREGNMNVDAGSSGAMARGPHTHDFTANYSGVTVNAGFHSHTLNVDNAAGMAVSGSVGSANNLPPFIDIFYCEKN